MPQAAESGRATLVSRVLGASVFPLAFLPWYPVWPFTGARFLIEVSLEVRRTAFVNLLHAFTEYGSYDSALARYAIATRVALLQHAFMLVAALGLAALPRRLRYTRWIASLLGLGASLSCLAEGWGPNWQAAYLMFACNEYHSMGLPVSVQVESLGFAGAPWVLVGAAALRRTIAKPRLFAGVVGVTCGLVFLLAAAGGPLLSGIRLAALAFAVAAVIEARSMASSSRPPG